MRLRRLQARLSYSSSNFVSALLGLPLRHNPKLVPFLCRSYLSTSENTLDQTLLVQFGISPVQVLQDLQENAEGDAWNISSTRQSCSVSKLQERRGQQYLLLADLQLMLTAKG